MKRYDVYAGLLVWLAVSPLVWAQAQVSPAGAELTRRLEAMDVLHHWLPGGERVEWKSGEPIGPIGSRKPHTHCSAFAAAACDRLGIYLLRPPEHSTSYLANAQEEWLAGPKGAEAGWTRITAVEDAQARANAGDVVLAVYRALDPENSGHIAIVRPGAVGQDGPQIIQAGQTNYQSVSLKEGFRHHRGAYSHHRIEFFAHAVKG